MEILSIGEKIKRSRIYKGYTLKDICEEKISVSKMSCIENGKINPEDWILEFVSSKLEIDIGYLRKDIKEQLLCNLNKIKDKYNKGNEEADLKYNLEYAEEYKYYDIAFEFMHMLFNYYLNIIDLKSCQNNTAKYYRICRKSGNEKNKLTYFMDIGKYFYEGNEYFQAANYYNNVRKTLTLLDESKDNSILIDSIYQEANCLFMMKDYEKSYEILVELINMMDCIKNNKYKAAIFNLLAVLSINIDNNNFNDFKDKSYELSEEDVVLKANFIYNYGCAMLETNMNEEAYNYINEAILLYPEDINKDFVFFMLNVIDTLIKMNKISKAKEICDKILNYSIDLHEDVFIEKSYYFKSIIMYREKNIEKSEMYMNLSLDILLKIGDKNKIKDRYMKMGILYFEMNNTSESLKYFSLALSSDKKI